MGKKTAPNGVPIGPTGRYLLCPNSGQVHDDPGKELYAVEIMQGPKAPFAFCPACRSKTFLGRKWQPTMHATRKSVEQMGAIVL